MRRTIGVGERVEEEIAAVPGGTLVVGLDRGSVRVRSHDSDTVRASIELRGLPVAEADVLIEPEGEDVRVELALVGWLPAFLAPLGARVEVAVPRRYSVDIDTRGGSVVVRDIGGTVDAKSSGGAIDIAKVADGAWLETTGGRVAAVGVNGDLDIRTSGGKIRVVDVAGELKARTSGGRVSVHGASAGVDARTSGGSIQVEFLGQPAGRLVTSGGSIEIEYAEQFGVDLDARTTGGRIELDSRIDVAGTADPGRVRAQLGRGGSPLELRTSGGSIRVGVHPERHVDRGPESVAAIEAWN